MCAQAMSPGCAAVIKLCQPRASWNLGTDPCFFLRFLLALSHVTQAHGIKPTHQCAKLHMYMYLNNHPIADDTVFRFQVSMYHLDCSFIVQIVYTCAQKRVKKEVYLILSGRKNTRISPCLHLQDISDKESIMPYINQSFMQIN